MEKTALVYLSLSLFTALFGAVYEHFSHGVYSNFMLYAFVFPLAGGTVPCLLLCVYPPKCYPAAAEENLYHAGIAALTAGSILCGILEIYGTTNQLTRLYWIGGTVLTLLGTVIYGFRSWRGK